ncbi:MAG: aspartate kinase, partial [Thermostichales cyanobacterium SZTDM-1c_bins_54]
MPRIVQKYGGTSVGSLERVRRVAERIAHTVKGGYQVAVVVSAMGHETDRLLGLFEELVDPSQPWQPRELDMLLATGEQVSIALVALALQQLGCPAVALTGPQAGIHTTPVHTAARIQQIHTDRIHHHLEQGEVVVIAGFQGMTGSATDWGITTLGRGGSDTTAVAVAVALQAECCEIYTDVPGVLSTDPRLVPEAQLIPELTSDEMLELASLGAQVMHPRAMEIARNFGMPVKVLSSWSPLPPLGQLNPSGTLITSPKPEGSRMGQGLELVQPVNRVEVDRHQVKVAILQVPDRPGIAAAVFSAIAAAGINVDLVLQSLSATEQGQQVADLAFTIPETDLAALYPVAEGIVTELGAGDLLVDPQVAKLSIAGVGMQGRPEVAAEMFRVLAQQGINLQMISTSEMRVSCVVERQLASDGALALGEFFQVIPHRYRPASAIPLPNLPVRGVALDPKQARLGLRNIPDRPGIAAHMFGRLAEAGISVDTIIQSQRRAGIPTTTIAFTVHRDHSQRAGEILTALAQEFGDVEVFCDRHVAKVSI